MRRPPHGPAGPGARTEPEPRRAARVQATFACGEYLFRQGEVGADFYIVTEGEASVERTETCRDGTQSAAKVIATLKPGACFGERALLKRQLRYASIRSSSPCLRCLCISKDQFEAELGPLSKFTGDRYALDDFEEQVNQLWKAAGLRSATDVMSLEEYQNYHLSLFMFLAAEDGEELDLVSAYTASWEDWHNDRAKDAATKAGEGAEERGGLSFAGFHASVKELVAVYSSNMDPAPELATLLEDVVRGTTRSADTDDTSMKASSAKADNTGLGALSSLIGNMNLMLGETQVGKVKSDRRAWRHTWPKADEYAEECGRRVDSLLKVLTSSKDGAKEKEPTPKAVGRLFRTWCVAAGAEKSRGSLAAEDFEAALESLQGADYEAVRKGNKASHGAVSILKNKELLVSLFRYLDADQDGRVSADDLLSSLRLAFKLSNASPSAAGAEPSAASNGTKRSSKRTFRGTVAAVRILPNAAGADRPTGPSKGGRG